MLSLPITGFGLTLREFNASDIPAVAKIASAQGFTFYALSPNSAPRSEVEASAERFVYRAIDLQKADPTTGIRESYKLAVAETSSPHNLIGYVALDEWSEHHGEKRDIGYFTDPQYQGRGIATQASILLLDQFFAATAYELVSATVHPDNISSRKVLGKLGYRQIGQTSKSVRGEIEPRIVLSLSRSDYFAATQPVRNKTTDTNFAKVSASQGGLNHV